MEKGQHAEYNDVLLRQFPQGDVETVWQEFLLRVRHPAHYNSPDFFLEPYWEQQNPFAILVFHKERVVAALTGLDLGLRIECGLPSRPQVCIDLNADAMEVSAVLAAALLKYFPKSRVITIYGWSWTPLPGLKQCGFRKVELEGAVLLDLRTGSESIFAKLNKHRRNDVRRAIRNGIEVTEETTPEDLQAYWCVQTAWRQTHRKHINAKGTFAMAEAVHNLPQTHRRFLARYNNEVIAASGVRFHQHGLIEYAGNCSRDEFLRLLPNDLLLWRIVEWACGRKFSAFSLGGAEFFHKKWGNAEAICRYSLDRTFAHRLELKERLVTGMRRFARKSFKPTVKGKEGIDGWLAPELRWSLPAS